MASQLTVTFPGGKKAHVLRALDLEIEVPRGDGSQPATGKVA